MQKLYSINECCRSKLSAMYMSVWGLLSKLLKVETIFENKANGFIFVNGDARGYSLKILEEFTTALRNRSNVNIFRDWGGFGIVAPDFREVA